ncbi:reverse transcriptase domain-containing protein, partial [Escherichia coli]
LVLQKGLNYAIAPQRLPYEEIICAVEDVLAKNNLKKEDKEAIRQDTSSLLRRCKPPKTNLPKGQYLALKNLRNRQDIVILRADKGNATVIMDTSDYNTKIQQLLSDESTYKMVKTDPTTNILNTVKKLITEHSDTLSLDVNKLIPACAKPPKLYGLPKIHKPNTPLRPIVSQIDTPTYKLAQLVAKVLSPLRGHTNAYIKDSYHFISEIKDLHLADNETMVSFDVQSLFTSLPVEDCIKIISKKLSDNHIPMEYLKLLQQCLTSGYLLWNGEFYKQVDGVAMGSPVSPVVADIFMENFEEMALATSPVVPRFYKRYVDDTFTILPSDKITVFLDHLNSIHPKIKFTKELENKNSLPFLDILVIRNPDNTLSHTVYRKETHTNRYLNGESHHPPSQLATVSKSLLQRAHGLCDDGHIAEELHHVKQVLRANKLPVPRNHRRSREKPPTVERLPAILPYVKGVTDKIGYILKKASIKTYYKPINKISQFLPPVKCHIPLQDAGVYKLDCDCGLCYIGQTKRSIRTRIKEHIADVKHRRYTKSAVCEHSQDRAKHYIRFDKPQILAKESRYRPRMIREAIEIKKHDNFNRDNGWELPTSWDPVIGLIKSKKPPHTKQQDTVSVFCRQPQN